MPNIIIHVATIIFECRFYEKTPASNNIIYIGKKSSMVKAAITTIHIATISAVKKKNNTMKA